MKQRDLSKDQVVNAAENADSWREWFRGMHRSLLARRLLAAILLVSTMGALLATLTELVLDYRHDVEQVHQALEDLQQTTGGTLAYDLWVVNSEALHRQLADILRLPNIRYVEIVESDGTSYQAGRPVAPLRDRVDRTFRLEYPHAPGGQPRLMGTVRIEASTTGIKSRLFDRFLVILCTQGLKTFLVSFFILAFFYGLVTRHLRHITRQASRINYLNLREPLTLDRTPEHDELNDLVNAFNQMRRNLLRDIELWESNEKALGSENALNQLTLNMLPEAVLRTDNRGVVTWMNPLAEQLVGHSKRQKIGKTLGEVLPSVQGLLGMSAERLFLDMQSSHSTLRRRLVFMHPDGCARRCEMSALTMCDQEQQRQGMVVMLMAVESMAATHTGC